MRNISCIRGRISAKNFPDCRSFGMLSSVVRGHCIIRSSSQFLITSVFSLASVFLLSKASVVYSNSFLLLERYEVPVTTLHSDLICRSNLLFKRLNILFKQLLMSYEQVILSCLSKTITRLNDLLWVSQLTETSRNVPKWTELTGTDRNGHTELPKRTSVGTETDFTVYLVRPPSVLLDSLYF